MKHFSFKTEVVLVMGAWVIASGLVIALYFTATTPAARFLSILVLILMLISAGWYVWNAIQISSGQKTAIWRPDLHISHYGHTFSFFALGVV